MNTTTKRKILSGLHHKGKLIHLDLTPVVVSKGLRFRNRRLYHIPYLERVAIVLQAKLQDFAVNKQEY